jgi:hypothetical protein
MEENNFRFDWSIIKKGLVDNWFESDPNVSDEELSEISISLAGIIDQEIKKITLTKLTNFQKDLVLMRDDLHGYTELFKRNISQNDEITLLKSEHQRIVNNIFHQIYDKIKRDFNLVQMGDWNKSWIKKDILELKKKYCEGE